MNLRLDIILRSYKEGDRWTWRLRSNGEIVASSGRQLYTRRIDCARGAEVGTGTHGVVEALAGRANPVGRWSTYAEPGYRGANQAVEIGVVDERRKR
jgi:hypothetical protein